MTMPFSMEEMADRLAIYDLYARYVHSADAFDFKALDEIFVPDTMFDWTECGGRVIDWRTARADDLMGGKLFSHAFHLCGNILIQFAPDRSSARVVSKTINPMGVTPEQGPIRMYEVLGGYEDRLEKTPDGWRIMARAWRLAWINGGMAHVPEMAAMFGDAPARPAGEQAA